MAKTSKKSSKARASNEPAAKKRATAAKAAKARKACLRKPVARKSGGSNGAAVKVKAATVPPVQPVLSRNGPVRLSSLSAKMPKNQSGLKTKELELYRDLLLAKRRELLGDVHSMEEEALRSGGGSNLSNLPIHMADMGTDNYEQEFTLGLVAKDRELLREINVALGKIMDGTYGICEGTGKPISKARLEAKPWARFSIEYARQLEKGLVR